MNHAIKVKASVYFNDRDRFEHWGEVEPVGYMGGYVPSKKDEPLDKTQESIRERFELEGGE